MDSPKKLMKKNRVLQAKCNDVEKTTEKQRILINYLEKFANKNTIKKRGAKNFLVDVKFHYR